MTKTLSVFILSLTAFLLACPAAANTISSCTTLSGAISCIGTADTPEDVFLEPFRSRAAPRSRCKLTALAGG